MTLIRTNYNVYCESCNYHWAHCDCENPNLVNKYGYGIKLKEKLGIKFMKLIQWFKDFNVDKEEREKFQEAIKDRYKSYFDYISNSSSMIYQLDLQYNLFKTQQELEKLKEEIKSLKKNKKYN